MLETTTCPSMDTPPTATPKKDKTIKRFRSFTKSGRNSCSGALAPKRMSTLTGSWSCMRIISAFTPLIGSSQIQKRSIRRSTVSANWSKITRMTCTSKEISHLSLTEMSRCGKAVFTQTTGLEYAISAKIRIMTSISRAWLAFNSIWASISSSCPNLCLKSLTRSQW